MGGDARVVVPRVRRTIRDRGLVAPGARVLVACSGGPDSAALLFALRELAAELRLELVSASVDHGLRSGAAEDLERARAQAQLAGVAFHALRVEVPRDRPSVQASAREARYRALMTLSSQLGATRIAVGHTQDDQAETVLQRVLRGAGLAGLRAVTPLRADGVIRPLIDCRRADVLAYSAVQKVPIAHDPSNEDPRYARVRVRNDLLPLLEREDPHALAHLAALADDARDALAVLEPQAILYVTRIMGSRTGAEPGGMFDLSCLRGAPTIVRRLALKAWLTTLMGTASLTRAHLEAVDRAIDHGGEVWLPVGWTALGTGDGHLSVTMDGVRVNQ